jgi:hypothetical protein
MTRKHSRRLAVLRRRRDYLVTQVNAFHDQYDQAECSALTWAISTLETAARLDVLQELVPPEPTARREVN